MTTIAGESLDAENNLDAQPVASKTQDVKISKKMTLSVAPYSANVIRNQGEVIVTNKRKKKGKQTASPSFGSEIFGRAIEEKTSIQMFQRVL